MSAPAATAWGPGQEIGRYRLERLLGRGGMGEVWEATDDLLGRRVAVKRVTSAAVDADARHRLLREAQALATVRSPHVVGLHDVLPAVPPLDEPVVVMELVPGRTLRDLLIEGPLPLERALHVFRQLAAALAAAHAAGVLHRDLKPANVMVRADGTLVVLDFGLAVLQAGLPPSDNRTLTRTGTVVGTADYMAPEQARGQRPCTQTDVWAAGVVLYEMLAGARPFEGATVADRLAAVLRDAPPPLRDRRADLPAAVAELAEACLHKEPGRRPRDGAELLARVPLQVLPLAPSQPQLLPVEVIAAARAHAALSRPAARALCALGVLGAIWLVSAATRAWPQASRERFPRLAAVRHQADGWAARLGLGPALHAAEGYVVDAQRGSQVWARGSQTSLMHPQQPPGLDFPEPTAGSWRVRADNRGRLRAWEHWPAGGPPVGEEEALASLYEAARVPATALRASQAFERGAPLEVGQTGGQELRLARLGGHLLRFELGAAPPVSTALPRSLPLDTGLAVLTLVLLAANVRARRSDLRGGVWLALLACSLQLSKLVLNPVTFVSGIWTEVAVEAFGRGVQVLLAYLAFEPVVRRRWPGLLAGWARLAALRRPDEHVGRELLAGVAALAPLALVVELLGVLTPGWLPEGWRSLCLFGLDRWGYHAFVLLDLAQSALEFAAFLLLLASVVLLVVRRPPLALLLASLAGTAAASGWGSPAIALLAAALGVALAVLGWRAGFVAMCAHVIGALLCLVALPAEAGGWTVPFTVAGALVTLAVAGWGYWLARAGWAGERPTAGDEASTEAVEGADTLGRTSLA